MAVDSIFPLLFCNHVPFKPVCSSKLLAKEHDNKEKKPEICWRGHSCSDGSPNALASAKRSAPLQTRWTVVPDGREPAPAVQVSTSPFSSSDEGTSAQRGLRTPAQGLHEQRDVSGPRFDRSRKTTFTTSTILVPWEQKKRWNCWGAVLSWGTWCLCWPWTHLQKCLSALQHPQPESTLICHADWMAHTYLERD